MKKLFLFAAALSFILGSCQNELEDQTLSNGLNTVTASIESQSSRLAVEYDHATNIFGLSWSENDEFTAFGDNNNANYTWVIGGTFGTDQAAPTNPVYAIYPTSSNPSITSTTVTMTLPASFNASAINLPMWSGAPENNNYSFMHLAAGLRIDTKSIPAGYNTLTVEASNAINGTFTADLSTENPALVFNGTLADANKKVTVTFTEATGTDTKDQVFYIPLPAGKYNSLTVTISDGSNTKKLKSWSYLTIARGKMYYTTAVIDASTVAEVNKALESAAEVPVAVNIPEAITIDGDINIPTTAKEVTLNFGGILTTTEQSPLVINQNASVTQPGEAISELTIVSEETIGYTEINTPTTTVTLSKGTYTTVTATTATNTLIIKNWVTIANLIVKGGNVIIEDGATVTNTTNYGDGTIINKSTITTVQGALDTAVDGTTIQLEAGVNYGTLVFRQHTNNKFVDINDAGGDAKNNERFSSYKNITIIGAPGAVVDQIDFQVGWGKDERYTSNASYIAIENLKIQNVIFSGEKTAINLDGSKGGSLGIDGLTIDGCTMVDDDGNDRFVFQQISGYKQLKDKTTSEDVMTTGVKNLTINNCTVTGAYQVVESRAMENLIITNNTFNGIKARDMLITSDTNHYPNVTYTGAITITGNTSTGGEERFVRASLNNSAATVTIKDNTITDYKGADADWIKVTEYVGTPDISNNTCTYAVSTVEALNAALAAATDGTIINLAAGTYERLSFTDPANYKAKNITIVGQADGTTIINGFSVNEWTESSNIEISGLTFKNITFTTGLLLSTKVMENVTVESCAFTNDACIHLNDKSNQLTNLVVKECTFTGDKNGTTTALMLENAEDVTVTGCTFTNIDFNVLQGNVLTGTVLIDNNTVNGTGDRVFRFVETMDVDIIISNNTITSEGDENGQLAKATNSVQITLTNNTWNGDTDAEVAGKLINITAK